MAATKLDNDCSLLIVIAHEFQVVTKKEAEEFDSDLEVGRQFAGAGAIGRAFV